MSFEAEKLSKGVALFLWDMRYEFMMVLVLITILGKYFGVI